MAAPPGLPTRFPCWVKAVYSWGGETKKDLGFIEGDIIECINAGDGAWWMGRLKRDRRMVGVFPSNFVEILPDQLQPWNRHVSPLPIRNGSNASATQRGSPNSTPPKATPQKSKSMFRKPFSAHAAAGPPNAAAAARKTGAANMSPHGSVTKAHKPYSSMKKPSPYEMPQTTPKKPSPPPVIAPIPPRPSNMSNLRAKSPMPPPVHGSPYRAPSPAPPPQMEPPRMPSPAPPIMDDGRGPSPTPSFHTVQPARITSPAPSYHPHQMIRVRSPPSQFQDYRRQSPYQDPRGPSPVAHQNFRAPSPNPYQDFRGPSPNPYQGQRGPSPSPYHVQREPSPDPYAMALTLHRGASSQPYMDREDSPPPPPPPPHRVLRHSAGVPSPRPHTPLAHPSRTPSPHPYGDNGVQDGYRSGFHTPNPPSPAPPSPGHTGHTPSPLTHAMNDVMSSLQGMGLPPSPSLRSHSPGVPPRIPTPERAASPSNIWSPDAFDEIYKESARKIRPLTSHGSHAGSGQSDEEEEYNSQYGSPPQVQSYVQRMENRLSHMQHDHPAPLSNYSSSNPSSRDGPPPAPPLKGQQYRPQSSMSRAAREPEQQTQTVGRSRGGSIRKALKKRKSAYELGKDTLSRTFTTKSNGTSASSNAYSTTTTSTTSTAMTARSLMSGYSAGGFSATSAGSLAKRKFGLGQRPHSVIDTREATPSRFGFRKEDNRPETPFTGVTYHSSQDGSEQQQEWQETSGPLGGLRSPRKKKSGFFKRMVETAKTGAANARSTIAAGSLSRPTSRQSVKAIPDGINAIAGGRATPVSRTSSPAKDMSASQIDWMQVRRDVNRANSLSKNERMERAERCELNDIAVINPVDALYETAEGDEGIDGLPIAEPTDFFASNLTLVDKSARFINSLPPTINPTSLAQGYVCRPYRSDVQRLRAIFTWVAERIVWEEDFEGQVDSRRTIQTRRGCSEEIAVLVMEMCSAVGLHAEVVRGYLKAPGEILDLEMVARPNHWWNAVIVDGEWRIIDCSLASPTNPKRGRYASASSQAAETWYFLARPMEICYTHVPLLPEQQHIVPPVPHEILMALPCACPPYFRNRLQMADFDTSLLTLENLELAHIYFYVPEEVECVAEVEAKQFVQDADGDTFESGEMVKKRALAQAEWIGGRKRYTVKALLPGDEGHGVLKVYAGRRGLMHSIKSNPHPLAFALPITHTGSNPPYDFLRLHPTPHATRHDLYVAQPQCYRLPANNTFVFTVRQHPSSLSGSSFSPQIGGVGGVGGVGRPTSPNPFARPTSALSTHSVSVSGSQYSASSETSSAAAAAGGKGSASGPKPAKLAIQSPGGKIIRLLRKGQEQPDSRPRSRDEASGECADGTVWETVVKVGERGVWRGLVLADRSARWCVFAEWECV